MESRDWSSDVSLPIYPDSDLHITATMKEVEALVEVGVAIIATDATQRLRPYGLTLESFFKEVRQRYPNQLFMADCSTYEEGIYAEALGFDFVGTTLSGYTAYTKGRSLPDYELMTRLAKALTIPLIAEGGIGAPQELRAASDCGAFAAVVGTAITRPRDITKRYVEALKKE